MWRCSTYSGCFLKPSRVVGSAARSLTACSPSSASSLYGNSSAVAKEDCADSSGTRADGRRPRRLPLPAPPVPVLSLGETIEGFKDKWF